MHRFVSATATSARWNSINSSHPPADWKATLTQAGGFRVFKIGTVGKNASLVGSKDGGQTPPENVMSQAIIDPEEVRRFAAELKRFNGDLRERTSSLMARFTALGDTWQDQEQEKFSGEFVQLMKTLKSFLELSERHTPYLLRKADRIQQYLDQR
jgi:uncharacterized protein YukE